MGVSKMTPPPPPLCSDGVILVSFLEKMDRFFLGTFVFGVKTMIPIFENDTGGELKKL
jgi:hypothetical protein